MSAGAEVETVLERGAKIKKLEKRRTVKLELSRTKVHPKPKNRINLDY